MKPWVGHIFSGKVPIAPLVVFRIVFGGMMAISTIRFMLKGWVAELYIQPTVFFPFYGFEWVKPLSGIGMYLVFGLVLVTSLMVMVGWRYRLAAALFFLSFTYIELIDKTNYLNHYYFVSLVSFLMIFMPTGRHFSVDAWLKPSSAKQYIPAWSVNLLKFQLAVVYVFAGIAKLNGDWLLQAMPLKIWLPAKSHLPLIGPLLGKEWVAYAMSWGGAAYDLFIVFFLLNSRTRPVAYFFVIFFHALTALLFPAIGMFPFIMILSTLIFFPPAFHENLLNKISRIFRIKWPSEGSERQDNYRLAPVYKWLMVTFVCWQLLMPWRYLLYPAPLFWREEGYRFSWRVMLMEKAGYVSFHVNDPATGRMGQIANHDYLTPQQEKMVATQPDMILQFAHFLAGELKNQGLTDPEIRAESWVTLNGRRSRPFVDPTINLVNQQESFLPKTWILPAE
ncbi:MAG: HTTM domain-containing protein [Imperialibacter sp.]